MKEKVILTDIDGVCLNWEQQFHEWMAQKGHERNASNDYGMMQQYDMSKHRAFKLLKEFNGSAWMGFIPAFKDARSGIAKLVESGYKFSAITSMGFDDCAFELRKRNLEELFGKSTFIDIERLDIGAPKHDALEFYRDSGMWWLEDYWDNAVLGADIGLKSIIIDHPHNAGYTDERVVRAGTWTEVVETIVG